MIGKWQCLTSSLVAIPDEICGEWQSSQCKTSNAFKAQTHLGQHFCHALWTGIGPNTQLLDNSHQNFGYDCHYFQTSGCPVCRVRNSQFHSKTRVIRKDIFWLRVTKNQCNNLQNCLQSQQNARDSASTMKSGGNTIPTYVSLTIIQLLNFFYITQNFAG